MFSGLAVLEERHEKRWTALASFSLQGIFVSAAVILPLLNPSSLPFPKQRLFVPLSLGNPQIRTRQENIPQHGGAIHMAPILVRRFVFPSEPIRSGSDAYP